MKNIAKRTTQSSHLEQNLNLNLNNTATQITEVLCISKLTYNNGYGLFNLQHCETTW